LIGGLLALSLGGLAQAGEDSNLIINGETEITIRAEPPAWSPLPEVISGWVFRSTETQGLQMDDFENPGMIFVDQAWETWNTAEGAEGKSCADCHGEPSSMKGVRTVMPKFNAEKGDMYTLAMYINNCRTERMGADAWKYTGGSMASMEALISLQSRGMPISVAIDGPAQPYWERGKEMYYERTGQLELSCANCHEDNYGNMIRADHLSQGQTNGFPVYRLKNAKLNTIHARFKGCVRDTRAETYKPGEADFTALELYVASRGNGLSSEAPSVRN
jgi:sulfur-oxidizing protein SoxA